MDAHGGITEIRALLEDAPSLPSISCRGPDSAALWSGKRQAWPAVLRLLCKYDTRGFMWHVQTPYNELQANCNLWRNWLDIQSNWQSLATIVEFWALASQKSQGFTEAAGPGSWNDPDMLIIGNEVGLTCPYCNR